MAISRVSIRNFKSLREVDVVLPTDLVALVGRNNSGKSAFLDALILANESVQQQGQQNPPIPVTRRGQWSDLTFGKNRESTPIIVELAGRAAKDSIGVEVAAAEGSPPGDSVDWIYRVEVLPEGMARSLTTRFEDGTELGWNYGGPGGQQGQGTVSFQSSSFAQFLGGMSHLAAERRVEPSMQASGGAILSPDGSNLIQVLNDLASRSGGILDRIVGTVKLIIPELDEVLAGLQLGTTTASGSIRETAFGDTEFHWPHLASSTQQIALIATFIHTTVRGGILLIEEPELYLHTESIWRLLDIFHQQVRAENKQIIMTTHSPLVVERLGIGHCVVVGRDPASGAAQVKSLERFSGIESFLHKHGFMTNTLLMPGKGSPPHILHDSHG